MHPIAIDLEVKPVINLLWNVSFGMKHRLKKELDKMTEMEIKKKTHTRTFRLSKLPSNSGKIKWCRNFGGRYQNSTLNKLTKQKTTGCKGPNAKNK